MIYYFYTLYFYTIVLLYRKVFWGQNEKIGHDISDLLRPNCPLDRLTNDNNSKINPDNTNKMGTMASTFFWHSCVAFNYF